ncbi:glucose-1-phosphate adenylyltransferase [Alginatibacterium sediminis]|uniref:Glucose-1-phosphate adenylyltransferase n=1 Tax=Alginatibacterium sediminis TaxID=2164068 RepID=A0A420EAQ7_9ALTE|nr:glucose-1-phosphate adenylyltransferase [Alginatibacterium sediminis]RKF17778.1 glucose-1-phosphate adenylyltransferase [Alginatibacterium sediminis]
MISETLTIVLAGGVGSRLAPLTQHRAKPAVPFGGKYRIIDFTLSNCLYSGLRRILVLTQYKSHSLHKHIRDGWSIFNPELSEYVTTVPPQQMHGEKWYGGTADAIYQNLYLLERSKAKYVVVLSGDHIYRMDYAAMLEGHINNNADLTIACMEVSKDEAKEFGVMQVDAHQQILDFAEKPDEPSELPNQPGRSLASMGVYIFKMSSLITALKGDAGREQSEHDFGKDIIPKLIANKRVFAHGFGGSQGRVSQDCYWRDVGTIDAYYQANMDLLKPVPPLDLYQEDWQIRTYEKQYPPARTVPGSSGNEGISINSITASGVVVAGACVQNSILFAKVRVEDEAMVNESVLLDRVVVGKNAQLRRCIIDKDVVIPAGTKIGFDKKTDAALFTISPDGVVVVPEGYVFEQAPSKQASRPIVSPNLNVTSERAVHAK